MFARVLALFPLALLVSATHLEARDQCNTGAINCCDSVKNYNDPEVANYLSQNGLLGAAALVGGSAGMNCSPLTGVGVGGSSCNARQQPVCCDNNHFRGAVVIGCSPINVFA